jgi:hypothetical protein
MSGVEAFRPQISVLVRKAVNQASTAAGGVNTDPRVRNTEGEHIDLTGFLSAGDTVSVTRSVRGPDTGSFTITFPDQMHPTRSDTVYGLVAPQDVIEIRMARDVSSTGSQATDRTRLPIRLRGFVSSVQRREVMTRSGPQRQVVISGHDYMKILQIIRFIYLPTMIVGQDLLTNFSLALNYGVETDGSEPASAFVGRMIDKVAGDFIGRMKSGTGGDRSPVADLKSDVSGGQASVMPFGVQQWQGGSLYDLLVKFGDVGPWNELYVEDRVDGPYVVYRPLPFKTAAGDYVQSGAKAAEVNLGAESLISLSVERTDANVANYFWVDIGELNLLDNPLVQQDQALQPSPAQDSYQNAKVGLYGIRLMQEQSSQWLRYDGKSAGASKSGEGQVIDQINDKRRILIENNKDNVVFETGSMRLRGHEDIRPGAYLKLDRGGFKASYYAVSVTDDYAYGGGWTCQVGFERGTGYLERVQRGFDSPAYLAELTTGKTYG